MRADPTHTLKLRREANNVMEVRFEKMVENIVNAFNQIPYEEIQINNSLTGNKYTYKYDDRYAAKYIAQIENHVNRGYGMNKDPQARQWADRTRWWMGRYVKASYGTTITRAKTIVKRFFYDWRKVPKEKRRKWTDHQDRQMRIIAQRVFSGFEDVSIQGNAIIKRTIIEGMGNGEHPHKIAKTLANRAKHHIKGGYQRAQRIVRTEMINAAQTAMAEEIEQFQAGFIGSDKELKARWITKRDDRVRDTHRSRDGKIYTMEEIYGLIGEVNCRCSFEPVLTWRGAGANARIPLRQKVQWGETRKSVWFDT